jgi:hypothetical protein
MKPDSGAHPMWLFQVFKYAVYALLGYDAWLFFLDDLSASAETFTDGVTWRNVVEAYSATLDTAAWGVLLLLFELETEVQLQLRQRMTRHLNTVGLVLKAVLYTILLGCAVYWGIDGNFLDFWDAFLWLVAFVFIEMNFFEWQADGAISPKGPVAGCP